MKENLLALLNTLNGTEYQSLSRLILNKPDSIAYIPSYVISFEEYRSFFKASGIDNHELEEALVVKIAIDALEKYPDIKNDTNFIDTVVFYPEIINRVKIKEKLIADVLFIKAILRRKTLLKDKEITVPFISFINRPSFRMRFVSARHEPDSIKLMDNVSGKIVNEALDKDPSVIKYLKEPTRPQKEKALKKDPSVLGLIKNQDAKDVHYALSLRNENMLQYIHPENRDLEIMKNIVQTDFSWLNIQNFNQFKFKEEEIEFLLNEENPRFTALIELLMQNGIIK